MIAWYDNIPVLSYVVLGARCRHCKARISWRYPVVELGTGLLFFFWVLKHWQGDPYVAIKMCIFSALLVGLLFSDLEERILPDEMTKGGIVLGLVFAWFVKIQDFSGRAILGLMHIQIPERYSSLEEAAMGAALPAFFLWGGGWLYQKVRHKEGLGFGDVKLIAMVGAFLGLNAALLTLILGSIAGSVVGLAYIKWTHQDASSYELPFGTFLGLAALAVGFWQLWQPWPVGF
jgi:leader peptidase (prepilin peptidase)/N-methyltransferase